MPVIQTERSEIHYKDYRRDDFSGTPYLLIHGAGSQYLDFPLRMRRGLQALAIDLPGHGRSPANEPVSIENYARDIVAFLDAMQIDKVILVGHSMGGAIAQQVTLDHPVKVSGLILIASGANITVNPEIIDGLQNNLEETAYLITKWSWGKSADEHMLQQGAKHLLETSAEILLADYLICNDFDVLHRLREILVPVLIIAGREDKMAPLSWSEELADNIADNVFKIYDDNGHQVHVEEYEAVIELIQNWVEENYL